MKNNYETVIAQSGNTYRVAPKAGGVLHDNLPGGTYTVRFDQRSEQYYLEGIEDFVLPSKIYGNHDNQSERILSTFLNRPLTTGVLLSGVKGSGKTLLAKQTAMLAAEQDIPTIVINKEWCGEEFNSFIQSIQGPAIILFDEFEKVYNYQDQQKILTLLDGTYPTKKLFLLTVNETGQVSSFLRNRPGRIFYNFEFGTLDQDFIKEYCEDRLDDKSQINHILQYTKVFSFFNFDMLAAVVEEMNRYKETLPQVLEVLNIVPETTNTDTHTLSIRIGDELIKVDNSYRGFMPNSFSYRMWADDDMPAPIQRHKEAKKFVKSIAGNTSSEGPSLLFLPEHIANYDANKNEFTYQISDNSDNVLELIVSKNASVSTYKWNPMDDY
jgi:hypothetical protein